MRSLPFSLVISCAAFTGLAFGQPLVTAIDNNYSYIPVELPNYGIAQGSIFVIFGAGLAAQPSALQNPPLSTNLNGVAVHFTVNSTTTQALLYYVSPSQIAGILPSNTPVGNGFLIVSVNAQLSPPSQITVVPSVFGMATSDQSGIGAAAAYDAHANPLTSTNSANPGETITVWGTGLGPISGDESIPQPQNLSNIPIEVDIGGVAATVAFHGRSQFPGLDQINVVVPDGASGCWVSVVVRTADLVSNSPTIPVAAQGRSCSDPSFGPVQVLSGQNTYKVGGLQLTKSIYYNPNVSVSGSTLQSQDRGSGGFQQVTGNRGPNYQLGYGPGSPSPGSCIAEPFPWGGTGVAGGKATIPVGLDAGPALYFTGPEGTDMAALEPGPPPSSYGGIFAKVAGMPFVPASGGDFTIFNDNGGSGIGPFSLRFNVSPPVIWSNISSLAAIDRAQGLKITWTGGDPNGIVLIDGTSYRADGATGVQLFCSALASAHQFTIPPSALLAMPPYRTPAAGGPSPTLDVAGSDFSLFSLPGLDAGMFTVYSDNLAIVPYF